MEDGSGDMKATFRVTIVAVMLYVLTPLLAHSRSTVEARNKLAELRLPYNREAFFRSAEEGHTVAVQLFLEAGMEVDVEAGIEVDVVGEGGVTALMLAAAHDHSSTVTALLAAGASVNAQARNGKTALTLAREQGHTTIVRLLKEAGAQEGGERKNPSRMTSQQIRQVQKRLKAAGSDPGPLDGQFGPRPQAAH
jgi:hypothetical protein